jgi:hypothetical protein
MTNDLLLSFEILSQYLANLCLLPFQNAHAASRRKDVTVYRCLKNCIYMALRSERRKDYFHKYLLPINKITRTPFYWTLCQTL